MFGSVHKINHIILYGGTFDPPHLGHLRTAEAIQFGCHADRFIFLPCKTPVIKSPALATPQQRIAMLRLALEPYKEFEVDTREITRAGPSFMLHTLESFREELGMRCAISLVIGMDAFMQLPAWHEWKGILKRCHLVVIDRQGYSEQDLSTPLKAYLSEHLTENANDLTKDASGRILRYHAGDYPISSHWLRDEIQQGHSITSYVPLTVDNYIKQQALYRSCP